MANKEWHSLLEQKLSRRSFLKASAAAAGAALLPVTLTRAETASIVAAQAATTRPAFRPIAPTTADELVLPRGYSYNLVRAYGDRIRDNETFGFNADYVAFFPIDGLDKGYNAANHAWSFHTRTMSSTDGYLSVNHEYANPLFVHGNTSPNKSQNEIDAEKAAIGLSIFRVQRQPNGQWKFVDDGLNRRVNGWTMFQFTGPAAGSKALFGSNQAMGSVGNCAGGTTPWGTVLSCEENVDEYGTPVDKGGSGWDKSYTKEHQGWVIEVDPYDPGAMPRKHTALGRFRHENVAVRVGPTGKVIAYMGDDRNDAGLYKFVSAGTYNPNDRTANMSLLENGDLYAADFSAGKWRLLNYDKVQALKDAKTSDGKPVFESQADVLAKASTAYTTVRGTPLDRPEDIEIHPRTGHVYIALTNNTAHGNFHGQIVRLIEKDNNPEGVDFEWDIFATGSATSGFSSPDNLVFDAYGNLWMVTDISTSRVGKDIYAFQGNNAMFFFATEGPDAGKAIQFASGPVEAELTGPAWTPDGRTLFLAIQHPGEESRGLDRLTSTWPRLPGDSIPRPAVVAINGFAPWR